MNGKPSQFKNQGDLLLDLVKEQGTAVTKPAIETITDPSGDNPMNPGDTGEEGAPGLDGIPAEPIVETPAVEENIVEEPTEVTPTPEVDPKDQNTEEDGIISEWDSEVIEEPEADIIVDTKETFKEIGKALEFEDVEDVNQLVAKVQEKVRAEKEDVLTNVPDNLKEAMEIAKQGGDYLSYLEVSSVDIDSYSDRDVYEESILSHFTDKDGKIDEDGLSEYMEALSDKQIEIEGKKIKESYKNSVNSRKEAIQNESESIKRENDSMLRKSLDGVKDINGFKVTPKHKQDLYNKISSGQIVNDLFNDSKGKLDFDKVINTYFIVQNFNKIKSYYEGKTRNQTKRDLIDELGNHQVQTPGSLAQPDVETTKTSLDAYMSQLSTKK